MLQRHGYGESANTNLAVASLEGGGQGWGGRIYLIMLIAQEKNELVYSTYYFIFSNILPLNRRRNDA